jgi:hypothetical protein
VRAIPCINRYKRVLYESPIIPYMMTVVLNEWRKRERMDKDGQTKGDVGGDMKRRGAAAA